MGYTEEEARAKQCCASVESACVGSACMAWRIVSGRWEYATTHNSTLDHKMTAERKALGHDEIWFCGDGSEPSPPPGDGWEPDSEIKQRTRMIPGNFERRWRRSIEPKGCCGLAGAAS